jgi:ribosome-associated translation inhibitor RaiA
MELVLRSTSVPLSEALRAHVDTCVADALDHVPLLAAHARVGVWVSDLNGPRGGVDKACAIVVHVPQAETVRVEERDADLSSAVARCAARLARALERTTQRRHTQRVRGGRHG